MRAAVGVRRRDGVSGREAVVPGSGRTERCRDEGATASGCAARRGGESHGGRGAGRATKVGKGVQYMRGNHLNPKDG